MKKLISKIKRRENPFFQFLYDFFLHLKRIRMPGIFLPFYKTISIFRELLLSSVRRAAVFFYYEPMFRSRCKVVGKGLIYVKLRQGFPYFSGNLDILVGNNVTVHSRSSFSAANVFESPSFSVGNGTYLGPGLSIGVAKCISIGSFCFISTNVSITDNDGHPLDPTKRAERRPVAKENVSPVQIEDHVWIGEGSAVLKGVRIGKGAVVGARSVVVRDIPPFTIVAGNPAVVIGKVENIND